MARRYGQVLAGLMLFAAGMGLCLARPLLWQPVMGTCSEAAGLTPNLLLASFIVSRSVDGLRSFTAEDGPYKKMVTKWTGKGGAVSVAVYAAAVLLFPLAISTAGAVGEPKAPDLLCQAGSVCGQSQTKGQTPLATGNNQPLNDPYKLYTPEGSEEGYVIGISPSENNQTVKFGVFGVPDNFPWGDVIRIQKFKIRCTKPVGGAYSRIEGLSSSPNRYWNVTCRILGPA